MEETTDIRTDWDEGERRFAAGDLAGALECYARIVERQPTIEALQRVASIYVASGNPDAAMQLWQQVLAAQPASAQAAFELGRLRLEHNLPTAAAASFKHVLQLAPDLAEAHYGLATAYAQQNRWERAEASARNALAIDPGYTDAMMVLSHAQRHQGRADDAVATLRAAADAAPARADIRSDLGQLLLSTGDEESAAAEFAAALGADPGHAGAAYRLGAIRLRQSLFDEAAELLLTAHRSRPDDVEGRRRLAQALLGAERYSEAVEHYRALDEFFGRDVDALTEFATALTGAQEYEEAEEVCERGLRIDPNNAAVTRVKGQVYFYTARYAATEALFQRLPGSLLPPGYFDSLLPLLRASIGLPGDLIECGVYKGGATVEFARVIEGTGKVIHACDTYAGMPDPTEHDNYHRKGDFADTSLVSCTTRWEVEGVRDRIVPHKGLFQDTLPSMGDNRYCFAFLDSDFYVSQMQAIEHVYPRMAKGGWVIVDDYGWKHCDGCKVALDEFLADKPERDHFKCILGALWGFKKM
jgi:tetratricopeptide (TPR) repeat protein